MQSIESCFREAMTGRICHPEVRGISDRIKAKLTIRMTMRILWFFGCHRTRQKNTMNSPTA